MRSEWPDLVTVWNRDGIQWRGFSAVELLWLWHTYTYESLKQSKPSLVRKYLTETGDMVLLARHDNQSSRETDLSTGGAP